MAPSSSSFKVGDQVWVKTGVAVSASGEELGTILSLPTTPQARKAKKNCNTDNTTNTNNEEVGRDRDDCIVIKYTVSGYEVLMTDYNRIRHMAPTAVDETDGKGRKLRRSGRSSNSNPTSVLMNLGGTATPSTGTKKFVANGAADTNNDVTPSANGGDGDEVVMEDYNSSKLPATTKKKKETKKRKSVARKPTAAASIKKAKIQMSSSPLKGEATSVNGEKNGKGSPYFAKEQSKSSNTNEEEKGEEVPAQEKKKKKAAPKKSGGRTSKLIMAPSSDSEGDQLDNDNVEAEMDEKGGGKRNGNKKKPVVGVKTSAKKPASKGKNTTASASSKTKPAAAATSTATQNKKKQSAASETICLPCSVPSEGNQPDGNGGLNQATPWIVEYSKTGRATCRSCDDKIGKGDVRVGHTPLFRGKPGYMVYRHLHCAVFSTDILCAEDVQGYEELNQEDYTKLAEQVDVSKEKIKEEQAEIRPDELVQKSFQGEMRSEPLGFAGTLLPFQVEGFSWMRHQEIMEKEVRGGILADEMGMGKTIQTIATILDNRPKLQHSKPGMKHPPTSDLEQRQNEEKLWEETKKSWSSEMDLLKVSKKLRTRDGGARAGTLVICPVIALTQWRTEIEKFTESGTLSVCTYHGPDRESETPRALMKKFDVVLTTYQVLESDFRKMMSPNKVECPNCGGKFKIDKLPIHLKYFCGDNAERTEAQARQQRNSDRGGGSNNRGRGRGSSGGDDSNDKKGGKKKKSFATKEKTADQKKKKSADKKKPQTKKKAAKKSAKKASPKSNDSDDEMPDATVTPRSGPKRNAARKAASQISQSVNEWTPPKGESDSDGSQSDAESDKDSGNESSSEGDYDSESSDDSALKRAREKQRQALEMTKSKKKAMPKKKQPASGKGKAKGKKPVKKPAAKGKKKKFDDDSEDDYSSSDSSGDPEDEIDMAALIEKAMAGAKNSVLHSFCWWRIILDEAHFIKSRSSQTANAAFSLIGVNRWALSGTPLQNRVGEFYSLVRFLRLDPFASYFCRAKNCDCKSMHYMIHAGRCEGCGHSGIQHYSHFNKYILNPIQRDGYSGDGRRAMFVLKNEVLDKALLRRTKETKAADMELPPRLVQIKPVRLHPVEEDFYSALYTQTKSSFDDYVDSGTLLNNYAHIFDLLIRMRQSVDHPYLVVYSKKSMAERSNLPQPGATAPVIANGSADCDLCHEPPTDRVVSTCCGAAYCRACVLEYMATTTSLAASENIPCPSCQEAFSIDLQARADLEDDCSLTLAPVATQNDGSGANMPSLKELKHVATGSILRRINLSDFATSSKIEALTRELVLMRQKSPGSKAIVFSQFVNMLDLIRWRLHSDPYLEDIGLGCRALHGGMNVKARDACLKDFRENNNVRVLLMSLKAGGVALNLTCANYIYLMDPWWNPAAEMQAIDRTHRLGQYRPIRAVRFIAENTVEERILQLQEKKRLVFDGTVGRDAGSLKMLTANDMKSLFA